MQKTIDFLNLKWIDSVISSVAWLDWISAQTHWERNRYVATTPLWGSQQLGEAWRTTQLPNPAPRRQTSKKARYGYLFLSTLRDAKMAVLSSGGTWFVGIRSDKRTSQAHQWAAFNGLLMCRVEWVTKLVCITGKTVSSKLRLLHIPVCSVRLQ